MSQSFRQPPRQIGFKPQTQRLSSAPLSAQAAHPAEAGIARQTQQVQQLQAQIRQHEARLQQTLSPPARSVLVQKLQELKQNLQQAQRSLRELRGQARIQRLRPLYQTAAETADAAWADTLRQQVAEIEAIYRVHQPLPPVGQQELGAWLGPLQELIALQQQGATPGAARLEEASAAFEVLAAKLWPPESELLQTLWQQWQTWLQTQFAAAPDAPAADDFELVSFDEDDGELEISFDFAQRKSVVRNQLGIALNQPKKSYQEYLDQGFDCIDQTVASQFQNKAPLYQAVEAFLEAVSLDKSRYEAYFGLGYLYSLVQDLDHALYFLEVAWKISSQSSIQALMQQLQPADAVVAQA